MSEMAIARGEWAGGASYECDRNRLENRRPIGTLEGDHLGCHTNTQMSIFRVQGCAGGVQGCAGKIDILRTTCKHTVVIAPVEQGGDAQ